MRFPKGVMIRKWVFRSFWKILYNEINHLLSTNRLAVVTLPWFRC